METEEPEEEQTATKRKRGRAATPSILIELSILFL